MIIIIQRKYSTQVTGENTITTIHILLDDECAIDESNEDHEERVKVMIHTEIMKPRLITLQLQI